MRNDARFIVESNLGVEDRNMQDLIDMKEERGTSMIKLAQLIEKRDVIKAPQTGLMRNEDSVADDASCDLQMMNEAQQITRSFLASFGDVLTSRTIEARKQRLKALEENMLLERKKTALIRAL